MPHLVIEGEVDLEAYARDFSPILIRSGRDVLRADHVYLGRDHREVLIEALVVEAGRKLSFYVKLSRHDDGSATLRIDPMTHPERSDGVRALVTRLAEDWLARTRAARVRATNLVLPSAPAQGESR